MIEEIKTERARIFEKANRNNLWAVIIFYISPISGLEKRVGYFESSSEACSFKDMLIETYEDYKFPYLVCASNSYTEYSKDFLTVIDQQISERY